MPHRYVPPVRHPANPDFDDAFELRELVRVLWKRRTQILLVAALVVIPTAAWTFLTEPLYRATTLVDINPDPVQVLPYRELNQPSLTTNYELFMKSQDELLRSPVLIERLVRRLQTEPDAPELVAEIPRLGSSLSVSRIENTQIFRLGYVAPSPETAARIANLYADEYIARHLEGGEQIREKARQALQRELHVVEERVQQSERRLVEYAQQNRLSPSRATDSAALQKQELIERQNAEAEAAVFAARSRLRAIEGASAEEFPQALITPVISGLVSRLLQLEHDLTALRATFGENWPAVVQKRNEVALVRSQVEREKATALAQARDQATLDYLSAEHNRTMIADSLAANQQLVNRTDDASIEFNILRREVDTNRKLYEGILERLQQANVTAGADFGAIRVVEPARTPELQDSPKVIWNLALSSLFGLALGICVALGRAYWDRSVSTVEEVERVTGLPVLGAIPPVAAASSRPGAGRRWLPGPHRRRPDTASLSVRTLPSEEQSALTRTSIAADPVIAEAVRNICASVLLSRPDQPPRVLLVTSTLPGEGKSTVAVELAAMLAERGQKTLLVECDFRLPTFATRFDVGSQGGLALWLAGVDNTGPTRHFVSSSLSVVTSGPPVPNPVVLLGSERMRAFLADARRTSQFVILDAPPVMGLADSRVLAPMADGVMIVVRAGKTQKPSLERACAQLESVGAQVIGTVLNGAEADDGSAYYYRHYYTSAVG
jgi:capsular exopolysaccharide synthesis family protein